jgi:hypothetical protein
MSKRSRRDVVKLAAAGGVGGLLFGGGRPAQATETQPFISHARTATLLSKTLTVTNPRVDKSGRSYHTLHKIELPDLRIGDVLIVGAEAEVTSELEFAVAIASFVSLGKSSDNANEAFSRGRYVCYPSGSNLINKTHHHLFFSRAGSLQIDERTVGLDTLFFVAYAGSDARRPGDKVKVQERCGHLCVTVLRVAAG